MVSHNLLEGQPQHAQKPSQRNPRRSQVTKWVPFLSRVWVGAEECFLRSFGKSCPLLIPNDVAVGPSFLGGRGLSRPVVEAQFPRESVLPRLVLTGGSRVVSWEQTLESVDLGFKLQLCSSQAVCPWKIPHPL